MLFSLSLVGLLCANIIFASPSPSSSSSKGVSLSFSQHLVDGPSAGFVRHKKGLRRRANAGLSVPVYDAQSHMLYLMNVTVGSPAQRLSLQIDTGSSDLWLPYSRSPVCRRAGLCNAGSYDPGTSSSSSGLSIGDFQISYVDGTQIQGEYITDTITLGSAKVQNQTMAVATDSAVECDTCPFQGIIGIGYPAGESIVYKKGLKAQYPNVVNELKSQGFIKTMSYSLWLNDLGSRSGEVLFGAVDRKRYSGDLVALPVIPDAGLPNGVFLSFTVLLNGLTMEKEDGTEVYSQKNLNMPVVLDSGTSLTYVEDRIAREIDRGVGAVDHADLGKIVPCSLAKTNAAFKFRFGSSNGPIIKVPIRQFVLPFPASYNLPACQWGIYSSGNDPNLFGDTFLRSAYVVYDLENNQIAVAQSVVNTTESDVVEIKNTIPGVRSTVAVPSGITASRTSTGHLHEPTGKTLTGSVGFSSASAPGVFDLGQSTAKSIAAREYNLSHLWPLSLLACALAGSFILSIYSIVG